MRLILALTLIYSSAFGAIRWQSAEVTYSDNCPRRFKACVDSCFQQWSNASGLIFRRVPSQGEIQILWSKQQGLGNILSFSSVSFSGESIHGAVVTINARGWRWHVGAPFGVYLRYDRRGIGELTGVALHELGHCIGLFEHSSDPDDTMFPVIRPGSETLSEGDIEAVRKLYR